MRSNVDYWPRMITFCWPIRFPYESSIFAFLMPSSTRTNPLYMIVIANFEEKWRTIDRGTWHERSKPQTNKKSIILKQTLNNVGLCVIYKQTKQSVRS